MSLGGTVETAQLRRVLLDACVPKRLGSYLSGHEVRHAPRMGWGDLDNGDLLDAMAGRFEILVTVDQGIPRQQRIAGRPVAVAVLRAKTNRLQDLLPLVPKLLATLLKIEAGTVQVVTD